MDGKAGSTGLSGSDDHQKILQGDACMKEWGRKNFISGIAELFDEAWFGA